MSEIKRLRPRLLSLSQSDAIKPLSKDYGGRRAYATTCWMSKEQSKRMREAMAREGYTPRKKSLWVSESINDFFTNEEWPESISYLTETINSKVNERLSLHPDLKEPLESGEEKLKQDGFASPSISKIIRKAVDIRILRKGRYNASTAEG